MNLGARPTLSVAIVCKDNAPTIGRTLGSVAGLACEVVALDSGSTDATLDILARHGARVHRVAWQGHVRTKQAALDACSGDWVLALDSDESLTPRLRASIEAALEGNDPAVAAFEVNRKVWWGGAALEHAWQPEWRLRLARRGAARWGGDDPHDALALTARQGRVERLEGDLRHDSIDTLADFLRKQVFLSRIAAQSLRAKGERGSVFRLVTSPPAAWLKQVLIKQAWRDGWRGWCAASAVAAAAMMKHAILLDLARGAAHQPEEAPP